MVTKEKNLLALAFVASLLAAPIYAEEAEVAPLAEEELIANAIVEEAPVLEEVVEEIVEEIIEEVVEPVEAIEPIIIEISDPDLITPEEEKCTESLMDKRPGIF